MKRIYHPYWLWEDYKAGFYDNCSGELKKQLILKGLLTQVNQLVVYMLKYQVLLLWKFGIYQIKMFKKEAIKLQLKQLINGMKTIKLYSYA